jgi:D-alanyl-D-alanine carboxypeptidase/D-alanyl-D-alanine-endopeptidase (penicillin-binding protein 4)
MHKFVMISAALAMGFTSIAPAQAGVIPQTFVKLANSPFLAKAGVIVIDPSNGQTLFSDRSDTVRAPASVLKLLSMTIALKELGGDTKFHTTLYSTTKPDIYLLAGESDPWLTASTFEAGKYHRAFSPFLINKLIASHHGVNTFKIDVSGLYGADLKILKRYFAPRIHLNFTTITSSAAKKEMALKIAVITSPALNKTIQFTLLWSDNLLADRLARLAAHQMGFSPNASGIQAAFRTTLGSMGVETIGLLIKDGNGLSKKTRISARTVAELLVKIKNDPNLHDIYNGLPIAGKTGTLKNRFIKDAPSAVGLIKAKTGWINSSVSLAGYVTVGQSQYVFTVIADHVKQNASSRQLAQQTIDKMLATIAKP